MRKVIVGLVVGLSLAFSHLVSADVIDQNAQVKKTSSTNIQKRTQLKNKKYSQKQSRKGQQQVKGYRKGKGDNASFDNGAGTKSRKVGYESMSDYEKNLPMNDFAPDHR